MRIDLPPDLGIRGIQLRQLERTDVDDWFAYLALPAVVEHTSWTARSTEDLLPLVESYQSTSPLDSTPFPM